MKLAFGLCALLAALMYAYAQATLSHPPARGVVRLRWATDANPARNVQIALFEKLHPGIQVVVDPTANGDPSKMIVQCSTGTGPDVVDMGSADNMQSVVAAGVVLDLTDSGKAMGFDPSHTYPTLKRDLEVAGRQYRFPDNVNSDSVIYNKKIFDDHGVPYPKAGWTYDDFRRTAKLLLTRRSKSGQTHLAVANWNGTGLYYDLLLGYGGRLFSEDGLRSALDSPQSIAAMQDYSDMMYRDKIIQNPAEAAAMSSQGGWGAGGLAWFSQGRAAMIIIGRWYIVQVPYYPALNGALGAVVLPRVGSRASTGPVDTRAAGINIKSPHRAAAMQFLQYLASPQYGAVIAADGDGLPPDPNVAASSKMLANAQVSDPAFHQPFIDAVKNARTLDYSPYIDANETGRWITEYQQKVENQLLTPREAMQELAAQINQQIELNLERRPDLQRLYLQQTGREYRNGAS